MQDSFENFSFYILEAGKLIHKIKNVEMKEFGLKAVHVMCIFYLNQNPQGVTETELARLTLEDKAAISRSIAELRNKEIVRAGEKRYNEPILLTAEGRRIAEYIASAADKAVMAGGDGLTAKEREIFYRAIGQINSNWRKYYERMEK